MHNALLSAWTWDFFAVREIDDNFLQSLYVISLSQQNSVVRGNTFNDNSTDATEVPTNNDTDASPDATLVQTKNQTDVALVPTNNQTDAVTLAPGNDTANDSETALTNASANEQVTRLQALLAADSDYHEEEAELFPPTEQMVLFPRVFFFY